jgi:DNA-binding NarL/FixJ family response regulator
VLPWRLSVTDKSRPRVLLADDHPGIFRAFQRLLEPPCEVVRTVTDGISLLDAVTTLLPDVVVVDLAMPGLGGLGACRDIKRSCPQTKIVVVTAASDPAIRDEAYRVGASGFVLKHRAADDLLLAIEKVLAGDTHFSI